MKVFQWLRVYPQVQGGTMVYWALDPRLRDPTPWLFHLEVSLSGVGDWEVVATVDDSDHAEDPRRRVWGESLRLHYRVRLETSKNEYISPVVRAAEHFSSELNWRRAQDIMRREGLVLRRFSGGCGYLYKRRHWGLPCQNCRDPDTGDVTNPACPVCYGTGIQGGYFDPVEYWIAPSSLDAGRSWRRLMLGREEFTGTVEHQKFMGRGLACLHLDSKDLWRDASRDQIYVIQAIREVRYQMTPVVYDPLELRLVPSTDVVYQLPAP